MRSCWPCSGRKQPLPLAGVDHKGFDCQSLWRWVSLLWLHAVLLIDLASYILHYPVSSTVLYIYSYDGVYISDPTTPRH